MEVNKKRFHKTLAFGWMLLALFIIFSAWNETSTILKWIGIIGGVIIFFVEAWFFLKGLK